MYSHDEVAKGFPTSTTTSHVLGKSIFMGDLNKYSPLFQISCTSRCSLAKLWGFGNRYEGIMNTAHVLGSFSLAAVNFFKI